MYFWQHNQVKSLTSQVNLISKEVEANSSKETTSSTPKTPATPTPPDPCNSTQMSLSLGQPNGAVGTTYINAIFTNISGVACTLQGFPTVGLTNIGNQVLGKPATQNGPAGSTLTVQPGGTAHTALGFPSSGNFDPGTCSATSAHVDAVSPGDSKALQASASQQYCPGFSVSTFSAGS